jgi:hypothetical protein
MSNNIKWKFPSQILDVQLGWTYVRKSTIDSPDPEFTIVFELKDTLVEGQRPTIEKMVTFTYNQCTVYENGNCPSYLYAEHHVLCTNEIFDAHSHLTDYYHKCLFRWPNLDTIFDTIKL